MKNKSAFGANRLLNGTRSIYKWVGLEHQRVRVKPCEFQEDLREVFVGAQ